MIRSRGIFILALVAFFLAVTPIILIAQQVWEADERVLAEWANKAWYPGKIGSKCKDGYQILYDDGDTKCAAPHEITAEEVPTIDDLAVGTLVLAAWGSAFYPAKVTKIDGSTYNVEYYDGYKQARSLDELRKLAGDAAGQNDFTASAEETSADGETESETTADTTDVEADIGEDITIWHGGSRWATIETDGDIWIQGSHVGTYETDGDVWVGSSSDGDVEADGDIWVGSDYVGDIEGNGYLWRGGSKIAEIEEDGDIYLEGSWWGEADPFGGSYVEMRAVAAVLVFFSEDFGFYE